MSVQAASTVDMTGSSTESSPAHTPRSHRRFNSAPSLGAGQTQDPMSSVQALIEVLYASSIYVGNILALERDLPELHPYLDFLEALQQVVEQLQNSLSMLNSHLQGEDPKGALATYVKLISVCARPVKLSLETISTAAVNATGAVTTNDGRSSSYLYIPMLARRKSNLAMILDRGMEGLHLHYERLHNMAKVSPLLLSLAQTHGCRGSYCNDKKMHQDPFTFDDLVHREHMLPDPWWYTLHPHLQKFRDIMHVTWTSLSRSHRVSSTSGLGLRKHALTVATAIRTHLRPGDIDQRIKQVHCSCDETLLKTIWNLPDSPVISHLNALSLPSGVQVNQVIDIPPPTEGPIKFMPVRARVLSSQALPFKIAQLCPPSYLNRITRTFSSRSVPSIQDSPVMLSRFGRKASTPLIIHMHGGGWISGSSASHEVYLRRWAAMTNIPIVSIDYRLAPEHKFPTAVLECFHVYKYIVLEEKFGIHISKVILAGDSAGGNIALAVALKCVQEGIRVPDMFNLGYPALDLCPMLCPSRVLFVNDPIVPVRASRLCGLGYLPPDVDVRDPLLSPGHASDEDLMKLNSYFYFQGAEYDPLSDELIYFTERLKSLGKTVNLKVYDGLPHGFLSMCNFLPDATAAIQDGAVEMKSFLAAN